MFGFSRWFFAFGAVVFAIAGCEISFSSTVRYSLPDGRTVLRTCPSFDGGGSIGDAEEEQTGDAADASDFDASGSDVPLASDSGGRRDTGVRDRVTVIDPPPTDPFVSVLPSSSCNGRRLGQTNAFTEYASIELDVWHLCYETPDPGSSDGSVSASRPSRVRLYHVDPVRGSLVEDALFIAPRDGNPWTGNAMLAASPGFPPLFALANVYEEGRTAWAIAENSRGRLALSGQLHLWRIGEDGSQTLTRVRFLCRPPVDGGAEALTFLVPESACPTGRDASSCGLSEFFCQSI